MAHQVSDYQVVSTSIHLNMPAFCLMSDVLIAYKATQMDLFLSYVSFLPASPVLINKVTLFGKKKCLSHYKNERYAE